MKVIDDSQWYIDSINTLLGTSDWHPANNETLCKMMNTNMVDDLKESGNAYGVYSVASVHVNSLNYFLCNILILLIDLLILPVNI